MLYILLKHLPELNLAEKNKTQSKIFPHIYTEEKETTTTPHSLQQQLHTKPYN